MNKKNEDEVWTELFGDDFGDNPKPKFKIGDKVRISKYKSTFTKGYEANFTEEIFAVTRIFRGDPNVYELKDVDEEDIIGNFYEEEMSSVDKKDDIYKVEKILKRKTVKGVKMVLVKWLGYGNNHNSWIPGSNVKDIK